MAKKKDRGEQPGHPELLESRGAEDAEEKPAAGEGTIPPEPPEPVLEPEEREPERPARKVWRTVAFATTCRTVSLEGGVSKILGGEFITHPQHVDHVRNDPGFRLIEVGSPAELAELIAGYAEFVKDIRKEAAKLGLVVYRDGEVPEPRKR